ncbi:Glyco-hydro-79C domain-containing protein [Mycena indigotica]|uniref:Glyco-hydro-79C domain-containing protein n=1 Tax=Mycena indigotica TaxID=2126181 RepID=A0A8H6TGR4_9AGAR|nr:Glyco-hydro-79C domain-containing protein [Mycena indigotica]KAF7316422.1 Glyco-hydro-79C domain-containing protein [Mycena indigotica]
MLFSLSSMGSHPHPRSLLALFSAVFLLAEHTLANVTIYGGNNPQAAFVTTSLAPGATYTGPAAYNPSSIARPPLPTPGIVTTVPVQLQNSGTPNLSIKQKGSFIGFSIEMSVSNQVLGKNSSLIQVPFLNLMANIQQRAGSVTVRVGGNSQESAKLTNFIENGRVIAKNYTGLTGTTQTPPLEYTLDLLYMMRNISSFVNVHWFMGIPWFNTKPFNLDILTESQKILGDYLLGLQAGNEPDMYVLHKHRVDPYGPFDYQGEMSDLLSQSATANADPSGQALSKLVVPNIANYAWKPEDVWNTGIVGQFDKNIAYLAVEKYPRDNCVTCARDPLRKKMFGGPNATGITLPQDVQNLYLTHQAHVDLIAPYLNSTAFAQTVNKPFLMFETNTASCGGFLGISDSFTAALWGLDYALQMAHSNFSGAMFHLGGQNVFYNPFTAPPTNETGFHKWSVGPMYYAALVMAEAIGPSNNTQVLNLPIANISEHTPIYGIYENGTPVRVAILNYVDDPSGANTLKAVISITGGTTPSSVKVKYLSAESVIQKGDIKWAGQTFGKIFESDGRPMGTEEIKTVNCDAAAQTCTVEVPAPGFALVFLSDSALTETAGAPSVTFTTTALTKTRNTATIDASVLATSNGNRMADHGLGGTSKPPSAAPRAVEVPVITALGFVLGGILMLV